jgi:hypothetical protein
MLNAWRRAISLALKTRRSYNAIKSEEKRQVFTVLVTAYSTAFLYL